MSTSRWLLGLTALVTIARTDNAHSATRPVVSPPLAIDTPVWHTSAGSSEDIASNGSLLLVAWTTPNHELLVARAMADGTVLDRPATLLSSTMWDASPARVASDGRDFLVVWREGRNLRWTHVDGATGAPLATETDVLDGARWEETPQVASDGGGFAVLALSLGPSSDPPAVLRLLRLARDGTRLETRLVDESAAAPPCALTAGPGTYAVAWSSFPDPIRILRVRGADGTPLDPSPLTVPSGRVRTIDALLPNDTHLLVLWSESLPAGGAPVHKADMVDAQGACGPVLLGEDSWADGMTIASPTGFVTVGAADDDGLVLRWLTLDDRRARFVDERPVDPGAAAGQPRITAHGDGLVLTFTSDGAARFAEVPSTPGPPVEVAPSAVSLHPNAQSVARAVSDGATLFVAWNDDRFGGVDFCRSRLRASDGALLDAEPVRVGWDASPSLPAAVAHAGGTFLFTWTRDDEPDTTRFDLYGRRVDAATGAIVDSRALRLAVDGPSAERPSAAGAAAVFLVAWSEPTEGRIRARRVPAGDGAALDETPLELSASPRPASAPAVASDGRDFFVAWLERVDTDTAVLRGVRVDASDGRIADVLSLPVPSDSSPPDVASDGRVYLLVWASPWGTSETRAVRVRATDGALLDETPLHLGDLVRSTWYRSLAFDGLSFGVLGASGGRGRIARLLAGEGPPVILPAATLEVGSGYHRTLAAVEGRFVVAQSSTELVPGVSRVDLRLVDFGACTIDETRWPGGAPQPGAACFACDPTRDEGGWTLRDGESCDDGEPCTVNDRCDTDGDCRGAANPCDDGDPCTEDACETGVGCIHAAYTGPCDDGRPCTVEDLCLFGACAGTPEPDGAACDDGDGCTRDDRCALGACVGTPCDDGNPCTVDECRDGACTARPSTTSCLSDGNPCTRDVCQDGACAHVPVDAPCEDGDACTRRDMCREGACVGEPVSCDDGDPCTEERCTPALGCLYAPTEGACDDGHFCSDGDRCEDGRCVAGPRRDCAAVDGPCAKGVCDELRDACRAAPVDDGTGCTPADACVRNPRCVDGACEGTATLCDDQDACTTDACEPATGTCRHTSVACPSPGPCATPACEPDAGCLARPVADGTPCSADGAEYALCVAGVCLPVTGPADVVDASLDAAPNAAETADDAPDAATTGETWARDGGVDARPEPAPDGLGDGDTARPASPDAARPDTGVAHEGGPDLLADTTDETRTNHAGGGCGAGGAPVTPSFPWLLFVAGAWASTRGRRGGRRSAARRSTPIASPRRRIVAPLVAALLALLLGCASPPPTAPATDSGSDTVATDAHGDGWLPTDTAVTGPDAPRPTDAPAELPGPGELLGGDGAPLDSVAPADLVASPDDTLRPTDASPTDAPASDTAPSDTTLTDTTPVPPALAFVAPPENACLTGPVRVLVAVDRPASMEGVRLSVDGTLLAHMEAPPFEATWITDALPEGPHVLVAAARSWDGDVSRIERAVRVDHTAPRVVVHVPERALAADLYVTADVEEACGLASVLFVLDYDSAVVERTAPPWDATLPLHGVPGGAHVVRVVATDAAGQWTEIAAPFVLDGAPIVSFLAPEEASVVRGPTTVRVTATDDVGVVHCALSADDVLLADGVTCPVVVWEPPSGHVVRRLRAEVTDTAGQTTTAERLVTVDRPTAVTLEVCRPFCAPAAGADVWGATEVRVAVEDDDPVASLELLLDGASVARVTDATRLSFAWDTLTVRDGTHRLEAIAAGETGAPATVLASVRVNNCDRDGDGYRSASLLCGGDDCDDRTRSAHPGGSETCDRRDEDCDGATDEAGRTRRLYADRDGDGQGDALTGELVEGCAFPAGRVANMLDCDDRDPDVFAGSFEGCRAPNGRDDDCDGLTDESAADAPRPVWYADEDGDGWGRSDRTGEGCIPPTGAVWRSGDPDDGDPTVYPMAPEVCDGLDNDGSGFVDDPCPLNECGGWMPLPDVLGTPCGLDDSCFRYGCDGPNGVACRELCRAPDGFVVVPAGRFWMGSPPDEPGRSGGEAQREITIGAPFLLSRTEVRRSDWRSRMGPLPATGPTTCTDDDCPVTNVTWAAAAAYANAVSREEGWPECYDFAGCGVGEDPSRLDCEHVWSTPVECEGYRLPTEAEWEYAYRAGATTAFATGPIADPATPGDCDDEALDGVAWYCRTNEMRPVGRLAPNAWGLFDMAGNAEEWVGDVATDSLPLGPLTDPSTGGDDRHIVRGGAFGSSVRACRAAARVLPSHDATSSARGFRLARRLSAPIDGRPRGTAIPPTPPATCTIDGQTVAAGAFHPSDPCRECDPLANAAGWTMDPTNACDDADACTDGDTCGSGACAGTPVVCEARPPCADARCFPETGCEYVYHDGRACDDGDACTHGDTCTAGRCEGDGGCEDGNPCTDTSCDARTGCLYHYVDGACDDGAFCTVDDACQAGVCTGSARVCGEDDACRGWTCDEGADVCRTTARNEGAACDDRDACTLADLCAEGECRGAPRDCHDAELCTLDLCDGASGGCVHPRIACPDDGDPCTLERCADGWGCVSEPAPEGHPCRPGESCVGGACLPDQPVTPDVVTASDADRDAELPELHAEVSHDAPPPHADVVAGDAGDAGDAADAGDAGDAPSPPRDADRAETARDAPAPDAARSDVESPSSGGGGCALTAVATEGSSPANLLVLVVVLALALVARQWRRSGSGPGRATDDLEMLAEAVPAATE